MAIPIRPRGSEAAVWETVNPILREREYGFETDTRKHKYGDGMTHWNDLLYAGGGGGSGGSSDLGYFFPDAAADGVTDDTDAINDALQAAAEAGGGTVLLLAGTYLINGSIAFPVVGQSIRIGIQGATPSGYGAYQIPAPTTGAILKRANNANTATVVDGGAGNRACVFIRDVIVRCPANPAMSGVDFSGCQAADVRVVIDNGIDESLESAVEPTHSNTIGLSMPVDGNIGLSYLDPQTVVSGFWTGIKHSEHTFGAAAVCLCKVGVEVIGGYHLSQVNWNIFHCPVNIKFTNGGHPVDFTVDIERLNIPQASPAHWYDSALNSEVVDSANTAKGIIKYAISRGFIGDDPDPLFVTGCQNVQLINLRAPGGSSSAIDKLVNDALEANTIPAAFTDPTTLSGNKLWGRDPYMDLARTIAATANNDVIRSLADLSGTGHPLRTDSAGVSPVLKTNVFGSLPGYLFDGSNDFIYDDTIGNLLTGDFTLAFIVKGSARAANQIAAHIGASVAGKRRAIYIDNAGVAGFSTFGTVLSSGVNVLDNNPHIILLTLRSGKVSLRIDRSQKVSGSPTLVAHTSQFFMLGSNEQGTENFQGYLILPIIYNRALALSEILALEAYMSAIAITHDLPGAAAKLMKLPSETDKRIGGKAKKMPAKAPAKRKFTKQVETFVEEMANPLTKSATEAAIKAGSPPKCARATASRWLTNVNISAEINERIERSLLHTQVTKEEVLGSAVRQMRSSMDDVLDERGNFDIAKARANGSIDFIKKLKIKTMTDKETGNTETTHEIELYSNQDGRKEVANYIGLEKAPVQPDSLEGSTDERFARELFKRMIERHGWTPEMATQGVTELYPAIDPEKFVRSLPAAT